MASNSYSTLGFSLLQELGSNEIIKNRAYLVNPRGRRRHEIIIPQRSFNLKKPRLLDVHGIFVCQFDTPTLDPSKRPEKTKVKPSPKKQNPKIQDRENDLRKRNHLHAFESLLSLMLGSEQHRQITMLSLKKSCGDISELLTRMSIGFAGIGIAVFFSVACSAASSQVPLCANQFFDTALSLSLVLLSCAVSRLRETIADVNRKVIKEEEEITNRVERRIKDVYFKSATVIIMVALRFR